MSISDFFAAAGRGFANVHRSYVLNCAYISRIQKYEIGLTNGDKIPIPTKRYKEIREELSRLYGIEADET